MKRRILSLLLTLVMVFSILPVDMIANAEATATIIAEEVWAASGSRVEMKVDITNNPGILGATLTVSWGEGLNLVDDKNGDAFAGATYQGPSRYVNTGTNFMWYGSELEEIVDGTILKLTFEVSETAADSDELPVHISCKGVYDENQNPVTVTTIDGRIKIVNYIPGDVSGGDVVDALDLIMLARYISDGCTTDAEGYNVSLNESAADVNDDGVMDALDLIMISRYISDDCVTDPNGYNIILKPSSPKHVHIMEATPANPATCSENGNIAYWQCTECSKYYSDAIGRVEIAIEDTVIPASHTLTYVSAQAASPANEGWIEHWKCTACQKYFGNSSATVELTEDEVFIDPIARTESVVVFNVYGSDPYLESIGIEHAKSQTFYSEDGLILNDITNAPAGYEFAGWTTTAGTPITEIAPSSSSRQIVVNANWKKTVYRVTFDTPDVSVKGTKINGDEVVNYTEYTVDTGVTLRSPECYGYTFVGWSNDNGFIIDRINPGTTGHMTLHANWTSNRNRATSYSNYGAPIIIEDDTKGQFLFVYDIGRIDNVPLYTYTDVNNNTIGANGTALNIDMTYEVSEQFSEVEAKEVIETVADATTRSSGWTLSEEWNDLYSEGTEYADKQIKSEERTDSQGNVVGGNYFVSNSQGGSSFISTESGGSTASSSKVTTDKSFGINASYDKTTEKYCDAKLSAENKTEVSAGVEAPVGVAKVSAGVKNTTTIGAEVTNGRKDNTAFHIDGNYSSSVGTVDINDSSAYFNTVANQSSNWNSTTGYEKSYQTSINTEVSQAIAQEIAKTTNYNISKSLGGGSEHNTAVSGTSSTEKGYSNSLQVSEHYSKTTTKHVKYSNNEVGYYRVVMAGTVHVYGVVGYDVATASYYTYTYSVLADETFEYVDYSKERATFDDCENGVVTFEVPYEVNEYILGVTSETAGLEIGLDGTVNDFEATEDFKGTVVIPQYHAETQPGSDNVALKTKAISSTAFKNNTEIKTVILPIYVTEIPDGAFEGCTNLETIIAYGVTEIGKDAFKGCTSLKKFYVDNCITELGTNAFEDVPEIAVMAYDSNVADAAIKSGAKKITVDVSKITDSFNNKTVVVGSTTEYFAIVGNGGEYTNLQIDSKANETLISKMTFVKNSDTPIKIDSEIATLSVVSVENGPVYALQLGNDSTDLRLYGEINLSSQGENTIISKNVTLSKANNNITSKLNVSGNYLVCGEVTNKSFLNVEPTTITLEEYEMYISPVVIAFDANNGVAVADTKIVYNSQKYGTLPTPQREYFEFTGWYTEAENGELITADSIVDVESTQTLYAHWKQLTSTLIFNANGGSVSTESKLVYIGKAVGDLPTPTRSNLTFLGWFKEDGTQVTKDTVFTATSPVTVKAHWKSGWVLASALPSDGTITDSKWTYDLTTRTTSNSSTAPSGYTQYKDPTWVWGSYGSWSAWSKTAVSSSDSRKVETKTVTDRAGYNNYKYYIYRTSDGWGYGTQNYYTGSSHGSCTVYDEINLSYALPVHDSSLGTYGPYNSSKFSHSGDSYWFSGGSWWVPAVTHTEYRYADRSKVYTYYYQKIEAKESSTAISSSDTVSNVKEWVQYTVK